MRSVSLFAVAVLAVILVASLFSPVAASGYIAIHKVTTNGDTTTVFYFFVTEPDGSQMQFGLRSGDKQSEDVPDPGKYTVSEEAGSGDWILTVFCEGLSTFEYVSASSGTLGGVTITYVEGDTVECTFTNSPPAGPVGGLVIPANTLAIVAPWLVIIGLVGCIGTVVLVAKKRRP